MVNQQVLQFKLFGIPEIKLNGKLLTFSFLKVNALIYYLVVNKTATRDEVASMLWPEKNEKSSKKNLRNTIYQVNKVIGNDFIKAPNNKTLELNTNFTIISDVETFLSHNNDAISAYTDEFLKGFYIKDSQEYDMWVLQKRQQFEKKFVRDCAAQILLKMERHQFEHLEQMIHRLITIDEFEEQNYRLLMLFYQKTKRYSKVVEVYFQLSNLLERELGILPSRETRVIYDETLQFVNNYQESRKKNKPLLLVRHELLSEMETTINRLFSPHTNKTLLVKGEIGVGKSVLCRNALNHVKQSHIRIDINCLREEKRYYMRPFKQLIDQLNEYVALYGVDIPKNWTQIIASHFQIKDNDDTVEQLSFKTIDEIETVLMIVLKSIQQKMPIILLFDDVHWMDEQSIRLLNRLIINLKNDAILFVLTIQEHEDLSLKNMLNQLQYNELLHTTTILPFTYEETVAFIHKQNIDNLSETIIDEIYERTLGVPFYIEEYLNAYKKNAPLDRLTPRMQEFLREQFFHLNEDQLEIAMILSYFETKVPVGILNEMIEYDDDFIQNTVDLLIRQSFLKETIENDQLFVSFAHQKYKEYLYGKQTYTKKRMMHKKIAQALEKHHHRYEWQLLRQIAYHFEKARQPLEALIYHVDNLQVQFHIEYQFFPLYQHDNKQYDYQGHTTETILSAFETIQEMIDALKKDYAKDANYQVAIVKFLLLKGCFLIRCGQYEEGILNIQRVIYQATQQKMTDYLAQAYRQMIYYYIQIDDAKNMFLYVKEALQLAIETNNYEETGVLLRLQGLYHLMIGEYDDATQQINESIHLFNMAKRFSGKYAANIAAAYDYLGELERLNDNYETALTYHEKAISLTTYANMTSSQVIFLINAGITHFYNANIQKAKALFQKAKELMRQISPVWKQMQLEAYEALCHLYSGNVEQTQQYIDAHLTQLSNYSNPRDIGLFYAVIVLWQRIVLRDDPTNELLKQLQIPYHYQNEALLKLNPYRDQLEIRLLHEKGKLLNFKK